MRRYALSAALLSFLVGVLAGLGSAVTLRADSGTTGADFLKIGIGARPAAMGSAYLALADDADAPQWNPAGLASLDMPELSLMHLAYFGDVNYEYLGAAMPWRGQGVGFGVSWLNVAPFNSTGDPSATLGSAADYSVSAAYAVNLGPQLQVGATARLLISQLATYSSYGGAVDAGATFRPFGRGLALAVVAQNLGGESGYDGSSDPLPIGLKVGAAYSLYDRADLAWLNLAVDAVKDLDSRFEFNTGLELWIFDSLAVRGGYQMSEGGQDLTSSDPNLPANFTAGLGLRLGPANVDYALVPMGELGITHRLSVSWRFGYSPDSVPREQLVTTPPKIGGQGGGAGVAFSLSGDRALKGAPVREWRVEILDPQDHLVRTLSGQGAVPRNLAWDLTDGDGRPVNRDLPYHYAVTLRDWNGNAVTAGGSIAQEIKPKELMDSSPSYDAAAGGLVFRPRAAMSVGVREWKLNIRDSSGNILKTLTGTGAIPKALVWQPQAGTAAGDNLLAGRQVTAIKYDLEFKDAGGQAKIVSDQVRFAMGQALQEAYKLPLPLKDFKVNHGHEILVASLPNLTSSQGSVAGEAPFVMPVPENGVRQWRLDISDGRGVLVRSYQGRSEVPDNLYWDGLDNAGLPVRQPEKAHFKFSVEGAKGELSTDQRKAVRNPFEMRTAQGSIQKISGIWFRFLDTDIQDAVVGKLKELAMMLRRNPDVQVAIQGHAWDESTPEEALRLSQERADAVLRYLIEEEGVSPRNVSSIGYGETMPLENAHTEDAAARNRRVEVILVSKP
jgi:outer membrane protein OmpA-like peptidoglycan-associated protein